MRRQTFLLGITLLVTGCGTTQVQEEQPRLPFQVALLPLEVEERTPPKYPEARPLDISLSLDQDEVTRELADSLNRSSFVRVLPMMSGSTDSASPTALLEEARRQNADLILQCFLLYTPTVHGKGSDMFWWNMLIQSLGGPFSWWVKDRSFLAPAELEVRIFDVKTGIREGALERQYAIYTARAKLENVDLAFSDRTTYVPNYIASIIVPVGLMARDNEVIRNRLEEEIARALADSVVQDIQDKKNLLLPGEAVAPFYVDADTVRAFRTDEGQIQVRGDILLKESRGSEFLRRFALQTDAGQPREIVFAGEQRALDSDLSRFGDLYYRYRFDERIPAPGGSDTVHLTVWTDVAERSFTFAVE